MVAGDTDGFGLDIKNTLHTLNTYKETVLEDMIGDQDWEHKKPEEEPE